MVKKTEESKTKMKRKVDWDKLSYEEMVGAVEKLAGARPSVPDDLPKGSWSEQAIRVLNERYFLKDSEGKPQETVEDLCWRVAWEVARAEAKYGKSKADILNQAKDYYRIMISREFLPNSPTLMNAGKGNGLQYSACYVLPVDDSLPGIFDGIKYQALVHQSGGGTGFSFSRLRPAGARVKSTMGVASGPVSFMRIYNEATQQIKQGGMRRGANMGILRVDHPDILEFIHCKEEGGITNFNISVAITDRFMEALLKDEEYELIAPHNKQVVGKLSAKLVWEEIAKGAHKTGDPGIIFIDRINKSNANPVRMEGWEVESTNPCVVGETLVSTKEGLVTMKEVVESHFEGGSRYGGNMGLIVDKRAVDPNETGVFASGAVNFFDLGKKNVMTLMTKSGLELTATPNHRMLTISGWKELKELALGDKLLIQSGKGQFGQNRKLPFEVGGSLPSEWSKELGQVLGWLVGDGWLRVGDRNLRVGFTFGEEDKKSLLYFRKILNTWYGKEIKEVKRVRNTYHLSYHAKKMVEFFLNLGVMPVKAAEKRVPGSIFKAPEEAVIGFLQGLFTADGTVRDSKKSNSDWIALSSKSRKLLQDVQLLLLNLGIKSRIFDRSREPREKMFPYKAKDGSLRTYRTDGVLYELGIFGDFREQFKESIGFLNEGKQKRLEKTRWRTNRRLQDVFTDKVVEIRNAGKQRVYDLTEPLSHSVIVNGLVTHQCGEQPLYPFDACNLGSIFLKYFVKDKEVDWERLREVIHASVRLLDSVIEMNPFPLPQIAQTVRQIRRIGLGVGGWADMLVQLGIAYDSDEALHLAQKVMRFVNEEGHRASEQLAQERGAFPLWSQSVYKEGKKIRNSTVTTIAPTGSIGILADTSGGIEPKFALAYQHIVKSENRTLNFVDDLLEKVGREQGFWSEELKGKVAEQGTISELSEIPEEVRRIFVTAHEISPDWHVKMQAAFQMYTDNAVSKTINLHHEATAEDIKKAYLLAWETGCRGITVFRDGCKGEQVLNIGVKDNKKQESEVKNGEVKNGIKKPSEPVIERPFVVSGATYRMQTPVGVAFITINHDVNGDPLELFINVGKAGSDVAAMAEALGRTISTALRLRGHLSPIEKATEIAHQLAGIGGRRSVGFGPNRILSLPDAVATAISMHFSLNGNGATSGVSDAVSAAESSKSLEEKTSLSAGLIDPLMALATPEVASRQTDLCPSCGEASLIFEEGCKKCYSCGHSEC